jgi:hypothetical protein
MIERNQMNKTKEQLRKESEEQMKEFLARGGQIEQGKVVKNPKTMTASVKNKGGRVFSDPTARFPKR